MSRSPSPSRPTSSGDLLAGVPPAVRNRRPGWRDPRIWVGLVIVAACVLAGARVVGGADDTVAIWSAQHDLRAGSELSRSDLELRRVHFADRESVTAYLPQAEAPAPGTVLAHDVGAGELLPRAAVSSRKGPSLLEVPVAIGGDDAPATLRRGDVVDVWVAPERAGSGGGAEVARRVLEAVPVIALPARAAGLAPQSTRQVIVGVQRADVELLGEALGALATGRVVLVVADR